MRPNAVSGLFVGWIVSVTVHVLVFVSVPAFAPGSETRGAGTGLGRVQSGRTQSGPLD